MPYVGAGVRTDCNAIINRFAKLNTLRYDEFTKIWRDMKFSFIYYGHNNFDELIEFTEEALRIAKELWLRSENLNEQAAGMYTLYGLYLKQPTDGYVKIRVTPCDYDLVKKFHEAVKAGCHYDTNYVLARMHLIGAFRFCVSDHSFGIEKNIRRYHENDRSLTEAVEEPFYVKKLRNDEIFCKLDDAFKEYHKSKCKLTSENSSKPPTLLDYVDMEFGKKLKNNFQKITQAFQDPLSAETSSQDEQRTPVSENISPSTSSTFKPPWWMIPVKNRVRNKQSSSESEGESETDDVNEISKRKRSCARQETRDDLMVSLGMLGDVDEEETSILPDIQEPGPSCSSDMPFLT